jgi:N6-adenosine-specific RNA methylase IME4/ParB-like chromosome segregation protein Spo0J
MRQLRPQVVDELACSIEREGLLQPIVVRPRPRGGVGHLLVAGWHRLMAVRKLKHDTIRATVLEGLDADRAMLAEIDENLIRADLTPAEEAQHVARRKELYEELYPATRHGGAPGAGRGKKARPQGSQNENFVRSTVRKTGKGRSTVARFATRGEHGKGWLRGVVGTCLDQGNEIDALLELPPWSRDELIEQARAGNKVSARTRIKQLRRAEREFKLGARQVALPDRRYGVIDADPEWHDDVWSEQTGMNRHAANHYPTSTLEVIKSRPVASIAAADCVLFLWSTVQHLDVAIDVLRAWGFKYKSHYIWRKPKFSKGFWNRSRHEILLIGTRGKIPCPAPGEQWESVIDAPTGKHSEKPEIFLEMIEQYYPNLPKIELNRRGPPRPGWDAWGFEVVNEAAE